MNWTLVAIDLALIILLVLGMYRRRHGRKDLVVSFIGANAGVLVVASALINVSSTASLGVGLGLFGVLSIIRLRSTELEQHDVAYFFSSLAMGLIAGIGVGQLWLTATLMALPVVVLAVVDHPRFMAGSRRQRMVVDRAIANEAGIESRFIGQINLFEDYSTVELPADLAADTLQILRRARVRQQPLNIRLASPEEASRERGSRPGGRAAPPKKPFRKEGGFDKPAGGFKARKPKP